MLPEIYFMRHGTNSIYSCFKTHMAENGCVMKDEDAIWLHFEVEMERYASHKSNMCMVELTQFTASNSVA
jgi:hypothetical protein